MSAWNEALRWWRAGDTLMPVMLAASLLLYTLLCERTLALFAREPDADARELRRGFALIRALTATLPLLGLLGTVAGMVGTFANLASGANGAAARQAGAGISLALTATQYGLGAAIPAILWDWGLQRRVAFIATQTGNGR